MLYAAKEDPEQTAGSAAAATTEADPKISEGLKNSEAVVSEPVNATTGSEEVNAAQ